MQSKSQVIASDEDLYMKQLFSSLQTKNKQQQAISLIKDTKLNLLATLKNYCKLA